MSFWQRTGTRSCAADPAGEAVGDGEGSPLQAKDRCTHQVTNARTAGATPPSAPTQMTPLDRRSRRLHTLSHTPGSALTSPTHAHTNTHTHTHHSHDCQPAAPYSLPSVYSYSRHSCTSHTVSLTSAPRRPVRVHNYRLLRVDEFDSTGILTPHTVTHTVIKLRDHVHLESHGLRDFWDACLVQAASPPEQVARFTLWADDSERGGEDDECKEARDRNITEHEDAEA